jgi:hypothetical protein
MSGTAKRAAKQIVAGGGCELPPGMIPQPAEARRVSSAHEESTKFRSLIRELETRLQKLDKSPTLEEQARSIRRMKILVHKVDQMILASAERDKPNVILQVKSKAPRTLSPGGSDSR